MADRESQGYVPVRERFKARGGSTSTLASTRFGLRRTGVTGAASPSSNNTNYRLSAAVSPPCKQSKNSYNFKPSQSDLLIPTGA